jgi:hypothetical protein
MAAMTFIERLDRVSLAIGEEEYNRLMEDAVLRVNSDIINETEDAQEEREAKSGETVRQKMPSSPELLDEVRQVVGKIKNSQVVNKSMSYISKFITEASSAVREALDSTDHGPMDEFSRQRQDQENKRTLEEEEEFQLQLALALSLSECQLKSDEKKGECGNETENTPAMDEETGQKYDFMDPLKGQDDSTNESEHEEI